MNKKIIDLWNGHITMELAIARVGIKQAVVLRETTYNINDFARQEKIEEIAQKLAILPVEHYDNLDMPSVINAICKFLNNRNHGNADALGHISQFVYRLSITHFELITSSTLDECYTNLVAVIKHGANQPVESISISARLLVIIANQLNKQHDIETICATMNIIISLVDNNIDLEKQSNALCNLLTVLVIPMQIIDNEQLTTKQRQTKNNFVNKIMELLKNKIIPKFPNGLLVNTTPTAERILIALIDNIIAYSSDEQLNKSSNDLFKHLCDILNNTEQSADTNPEKFIIIEKLLAIICHLITRKISKLKQNDIDKLFSRLLALTKNLAGFAHKTPSEDLYLILFSAITILKCMLDEAGSKISEDNKHKLFMCVCDLFKNMNERDTRLDTSPPLTYMLVNIILKFCGEPEMATIKKTSRLYKDLPSLLLKNLEKRIQLLRREQKTDDINVLVIKSIINILFKTIEQGDLDRKTACEIIDKISNIQEILNGKAKDSNIEKLSLDIFELMVGTLVRSFKKMDDDLIERFFSVLLKFFKLLNQQLTSMISFISIMTLEGVVSKKIAKLLIDNLIDLLNENQSVVLNEDFIRACLTIIYIYQALENNQRLIIKDFFAEMIGSKLEQDPKNNSLKISWFLYKIVTRSDLEPSEFISQLLNVENYENSKSEPMNISNFYWAFNLLIYNKLATINPNQRNNLLALLDKIINDLESSPHDDKNMLNEFILYKVDLLDYEEQQAQEVQQRKALPPSKIIRRNKPTQTKPKTPANSEVQSNSAIDGMVERLLEGIAQEKLTAAVRKNLETILAAHHDNHGTFNFDPNKLANIGNPRVYSTGVLVYNLNREMRLVILIATGKCIIFDKHSNYEKYLLSCLKTLNVANKL